MTREETDAIKIIRKYECNKEHYDACEMLIKKLEQPQEPKTGYISIDDVMSVFDDFMRGEADEDETNTFLEMLKDKAESKEKDVI